MHRASPIGIRQFLAVVLPATFVATGCAQFEKGRIAGEGGSGPWWMQQTAFSDDGALDLASRPWWPRAAELALHESFPIEAEDGQGPARPNVMLVRREQFTIRSGEQVDAIVWIIDDDGDNLQWTINGDRDSDCYVVDYHRDGIVDRVVDYIDNDGDNDPDEMDIRYFADGKLNFCWFGLDLDDDSEMWSLAGYEYGGPSFFESDPYGDSMIFMNKFDPTRGTWSPISECPFAFYDTDNDRCSEVVVRVSAVPMSSDPGAEPDFANTHYASPWNEAMRRMGALNIRYSFDIDNLSSAETPLHYDWGFNLVGAVEYDFAGMHRTNAKRRPPQTTCVIPHDRLRGICNRYPALQTGFTWHEQHDDTISIGYGDQADHDFGWEGVFWIWERRFMPNTGGPGQKWNVRREWTDKPSDRRELYYSEVDRRIHLFGAKEGWIQIGHFSGMGELGEIRMLDTDDNGYFDRWEVYQAGRSDPLRVTTVRDERARRVPFDDDRLHALYCDQVLPDAMAANRELMDAMGELQPFQVPAGLARAMNTGSPNHRRFAQDVVREMHYHNLRRAYTEKLDAVLANAAMDDLRPLSAEARSTTAHSGYAWRLARALQNLDVAYGQGDYDSARIALTDISRIEASVQP